MPLIKNQKDLYMHAEHNHYIIPACHFCEVLTLHAVLDAAKEENSPVILQIGVPNRPNFSPMPQFITYVEEVCRQYPVPVILNHDHISTVDSCRWAIDNGFLSVMFDGSHLPFEENIDKTKEITEYAHSRGACVEAELGSIPGFEDLVFSENSVFTEPEKAAEFIRRTGCDSLAVAVGTAHGGVKAGHPLEIDFGQLQSIKKAVGDFPLVLHGAASLPEFLVDEVNRYGGKAEYLDMCREETIEKTRYYGVVKANMDVDNMLVFTAALRKEFTEHPEKYNHTQYLKTAAEAMKNEVRRKMRDVTKSAGHAAAFWEVES
ncbi:MAG: class II fructose-bisphosphate aldolase family protein [Clostridiaceae bacterium]|nr:class II fructose-bisphosphate aldolase family protein [Clostridiaceae bacterium]